MADVEYKSWWERREGRRDSRFTIREHISLARA
jgi:hypothetical protein